MDFKSIVSEEVNKAIGLMGFKEPTPVQSQVIEVILKKQDLVVKAKTGSGKTAAFAIPLVDKIGVDVVSPKALILTPTRELAVQVHEEIGAIGRYKKIRSLVVYGKQSITKQINQLKQRVHIVVGTPGRVMDLIRRGDLKLEEIEYFVLDEADELLRRGFLEDIEYCFDQLPEGITTLLFSATMPDDIKAICDQRMEAPKWVEIEEEPPEIHETNIFGDDLDKFRLLQLALKKYKPFTCMIFCNTKVEVDNLYGQIKSAGISGMKLHGGMNQRDRLRTIDAFKKGDAMCLVATDLAARGIHVDSLDLVINYYLPLISENYTHRIGRTGRKNEAGHALSFIDASEIKELKEIEKFLGCPMPITGIKAFAGEDYEDFIANSRTNTRKLMKERAEKKDAFEKKRQKIQVAGDVTKIRIGIGKKKKIRTLDIVGAISSIEGIEGDDIGIVDVRDTCTYVDIMNHKGNLVLKELGNVKGKRVKVVKIKKQRD